MILPDIQKCSKVVPNRFWGAQDTISQNQLKNEAITCQVWAHEGSTFKRKKGYKTGIYPVLQNLTLCNINITEYHFDFEIPHGSLLCIVPWVRSKNLHILKFISP